MSVQNSHREELKKELIRAYRSLVKERYQYEALANQYQLPEAFSKEKIDLLRHYFLTYIYPEYEVRQKLERAFEALDEHLRHPDQLFRMIIDSGKLIFTYGRHLPKLIRAGLKALKSFRAAASFEANLLQIAIDSKEEPPFTRDQIKNLLSGLSSSKIDNFIEDNLALFDTLYDRKLVARIINIVEHLIDTMIKNPKTYSPEELAGLEWAKEIIVRGDQLFNQLTPEEQKIVLTWTQKIERDFISNLKDEQKEA